MAMGDRKDEILALTDQLVKSVGYGAFSYADLSEALGITKASIHHHFPRKEDLGAALCDRYAEGMRRGFEKAEAAPGTAWSKLERYFGQGSALVADHAKNCPLAALQAQVNTLPEPMKERLKGLDDIELGFFARVLAAGRDRGELSFPGQPEAQAALMLSAYKGALAFARVHGCRFFKDTMAQMKAMVGA